MFASSLCCSWVHISVFIYTFQSVKLIATISGTGNFQELGPRWMDSLRNDNDTMTADSRDKANSFLTTIFPRYFLWRLFFFIFVVVVLIISRALIDVVWEDSSIVSTSYIFIIKKLQMIGCNERQLNGDLGDEMADGGWQWMETNINGWKMMTMDKMVEWKKEEWTKWRRSSLWRLNLGHRRDVILKPFHVNSNTIQLFIRQAMCQWHDFGTGGGLQW